MILLSQLINSQSVPLGGSGFIVLFNGLYIIVKLILSIINARKFKGNIDKKSLLFCSLLYLSCAESLFLFYVLFGKMIEMYGWRDDEMLVTINYVEGLIFGVVSILLGCLLIYKGIKVRRNEESR